MKGLSVKQPWASRIASGAKTIETRTWSTDYRGDLLIHASRCPRSKNSGKALCVVEVRHCRPMRTDDQEAAMCVVYPGAVSWLPANVRPINPIPVRGALGLWHVGDDVLAKLEFVLDQAIWTKRYG